VAPAACVFCRIARGEVPAHFVLEDATCLAFLDARPLFQGHVLVTPRAHHETLTDLPTELVAALFNAARVLCSALEHALGAQGTFVAMNNRISQSVPHAHVHVVPRTKGDGLRGFFWPRGKYDSEQEASQVAAKVRAAVLRLRG
jgi:histidine triad (HIT) family protein